MISDQTLGSICAEGGGDIQTGPFGSQLHASDYVPEGVPAVMPKDIRVEAIDSSDIAKITERDAQRLSKYRLATGDIVYSRRGDVEKCTIISERENGWLCGTGCLRVRIGRSKYSPAFIHAYLSSAPVRAYISQRAVGATMPNLNTGILGAIPIPDFPAGRIEAVGKNWATINNKLLLNQRMNKTLEDIAQAIFKCWFVDFEPTRAKMAGENEASICNRLKITPDILALFPERLIESDEGKIPEAWSRTTLAKLAGLNVKSWSKRAAPLEVHYVDLANTKWGKIQSTETFPFEEAPSRARRILRAGDTIVGTVRPGNGSYAFISADGYTASTGFAVLSPRKPEYAEFVYLSSTSQDNIARLTHLADGGAYPAVRPDLVLSTECILPSAADQMDALLNAYSSVVAKFFSLRATNDNKDVLLTNIRDALLPKLLSGEIFVGEAQDIAERT